MRGNDDALELHGKLRQAEHIRIRHTHTVSADIQHCRILAALRRFNRRDVICDLRFCIRLLGTSRDLQRLDLKLANAYGQRADSILSRSRLLR